jgi:hypothetical protein
MSKGVCPEAFARGSTFPTGPSGTFLSNCIYFLEFNNFKNNIPLQVSKLYEVVPPILTELGKVMWYQIDHNFSLLWFQPTGYEHHSLPMFSQVKNPWPNVDAHSGVLLNHFGLSEARYVYALSFRFQFSDVFIYLVNKVLNEHSCLEH